MAYFAANQPPDLGSPLARGRMIASSICSSCHGAALDGVGEPSGDIQGALAYDDAAFDRLLVESVDRTGKKVTMEFGFGHEAQQLTAAERRDVIAYVRELAGRFAGPQERSKPVMRDAPEVTSARPKCPLSETVSHQRP